MAKDVLWFEISMEESIFVKVRQACGDFEEDGSNLVLSESAATFLGSHVDLIKIALQVVKDQVQLFI